MPLIPHSHAERLARKADKRRRLLSFLRLELWTTPSVAGMVMGVSDRATIKSTIDRMEVDGLVVRDRVRMPLGLVLHVVGITMNGQAEAGSTGKPFVARAYETGRIGLTVIDHTLELQRLRIAAARAGYKGWAYLDRITVEQRKESRQHRADALVTHPGGVRAALECERTLKSRKRYQVIVGDHLSAIGQRQYERVIWTCPNAAIADSLRKIINSIPRVIVAGVDNRMGQQEQALFTFCTYTEFPTIEL
ncbi:MAG: MobC family replication-relaxation protein [Pseudomonadota bacterium]|nr:MobC family replication-relaxation protein [Pseudomonadota bacterium]